MTRGTGLPYDVALGARCDCSLDCFDLWLVLSMAPDLASIPKILDGFSTALEFVAEAELGTRAR